ncbi:mitotic fidelity of chromosome transmission- protein [Coemansia sp. RSA 486]|nr:mitotic fidelity of chromosome transmission- protein [Coemansia sp. RSA 486]
MSNRAVRRAKSPANRNKFSDIGITGRKTGVRVTGTVRVDDDGLENVDEFYKHTSPNMEQPLVAKTSRSFHALLSPTPIRSMPEYGTLIGALDMPDIEGDYREIEDEVITTPVHARAIRAQVLSAATEYARSPEMARRATMVPGGGREPSWVNSPKKGRRVTMAFAAAAQRAGEKELEVEEEELNFGPVVDTGADQEDEQEDDQEDLVEYEPQTEDVVNGDHYEGEEEEEVDEAQEVEAEAEAEAEEVDEAEDMQQDNVDDDRYNIEDPDTLASDSGDPQDADQQVDEQPVEEEDQNSSAPTKRKAQQPSKGKEPAKDTQPLRRSTRAVVQPLAYWRNEHVEYEYESGATNGVPVPRLKNVVRVRKTAEEKNQAKKRRVRRVLPSLRNISQNELDLDDRGRFYYYDDENYGFPVKDDRRGEYGPRYTDKAKPRGSGKRALDALDDNDDIPVDERPKKVVGADGESEVMQEIVISRQSIHWSDAGVKNNKFKAGFGLIAEQENGEILASSGILSIAVGGHKPPRNCGPRTLLYLVTSGQVEVKVNRATFRVGILGQFLVPTNNTYSIANVGTHPAQLYYVHVCVPPSVAPVDEPKQQQLQQQQQQSVSDDGEQENSGSEIE